MHAVVYHGSGQKSWEETEDPKIEEDTDAIVRIDTVTICGTDLHILKGDVPEMTPGRILGHEAVGTVVEAGAGVKTVGRDDRVLLSCVSACGRCRYCRVGQFGQCLNGGGVDLRPPDRRGRVRPGPVRRQLGVQDPGGNDRRAGPVPVGFLVCQLLLPVEHEVHHAPVLPRSGHGGLRHVRAGR